MGSKRSHVFNNNRQRSRLRGRPKSDGVTVYKRLLINAKSHIGKRGQNTELTGRSPLRRRNPHWTVVPFKKKKKEKKKKKNNLLENCF
jgi:hypothetical protein